MKRHIPLAIRHRVRQMPARFSEIPLKAAEAAATRRDPLARSYRVWYLRRRFAGLLALLRPDALVFDVGANVGTWTEVLRSFGCRVVAVEPQAACVARLASRYARDAGVTVVVAAVAETAGELELFLAGSSQHASASRRWIDEMVTRGGFAPDYWQETVTVPARTLDDLIEEFGEPDYLKLDVEGSELPALLGLSQPLPLLSFETHGEALEAARACVARLLELAPYDFNLAPGTFPELDPHGWRSGEEVQRALAAQPHGWNNVFARRR